MFSQAEFCLDTRVPRGTLKVGCDVDVTTSYRRGCRKQLHRGGRHNQLQRWTSQTATDVDVANNNRRSHKNLCKDRPLGEKFHSLSFSYNSQIFFILHSQFQTLLQTQMLPGRSARYFQTDHLLFLQIALSKVHLLC